MKDQIISFETAKLAKEKGFCFTTVKYDNNSFYLFDKDGILHHNLSDDITPAPVTPAPSQSLLQKWLRETHNLNVKVSHLGYNKKDKHFSFRCIVILITKTKNLDIIECLSDIKEDFYIFRSYEEALEKGLLEALKSI